MANDTPYPRLLASDTEVHRTTFDPDTESVSDAIVRAVASVTGEEPAALEPIEAVVDPIIFDALVRRRRRDIRLSFVYHDQRVVVDSSGDIIVQRCQTDTGASHRFQFDDSDSASDAVVRAIAATRGVDETEVESLYNYVDPEALDRLFGGADGSDPVVSLCFDGRRIRVTGENSVVVPEE